MEEQDLGHLEFFSCRKFDLNSSSKTFKQFLSHMVCWLESSSSMMFPAMKSSMACLMTDTAPPDIFFYAGDLDRDARGWFQTEPWAFHHGLPEIRDKSTKFYKCKSKRTWRFPIHGGTPKSFCFVVFYVPLFEPSSYRDTPPFMETLICQSRIENRNVFRGARGTPGSSEASACLFHWLSKPLTMLQRHRGAHGYPARMYYEILWVFTTTICFVCLGQIYT